MVFLKKSFCELTTVCVMLNYMCTALMYNMIEGVYQNNERSVNHHGCEENVEYLTQLEAKTQVACEDSSIGNYLLQ